ncbi:MAG: cleavage protein [Desulfitobacteriia bacterium]
MTNKECTWDCIYSVNGVCRLENTHGRKNPQCPFKEGNQTAASL